MNICATTSIFAGDKTYDPVFERIDKIVKCGINTIRFNIKVIDAENAILLKKIVSTLKLKYPSVQILLDLPLPKKKPRVRVLTDCTSLRLLKDDIVYFVNDLLVGEELIQKNENINCVFVKDLVNIKSIINIDNEIYYDDGKGCFKFIEHINNNCIKAKSISKIVIYDNKSLPYPIPNVLTNEDVIMLKNLIADIKPYIVAFSFIESKDDLILIKGILNDQSVKVMCKIETQKSVKQLEDFIDKTDYIMIARGDLGYDIELNTLLETQEKLIKVAQQYHKKVYIATDFLSSLQFRVVPSRSDIIDLSVCALQKPDGIILNASIANVELAMKYITDIIPDII